MFNIAKKVIVVNIRNSKFVLFNALFPIFLMILIGSMLSNEFSTNNRIDKVVVSIYDDGSEKSKLILDNVKENADSKEIEFKQIKSIEEGEKLARLDESIFVHLDKNDINIYANNNSQIDSGIVNSLFKSVSSRVNAMSIIYDQGRSSTNKNNIRSNIEIKNISIKETPSSFDYYGVAELTMISIYAALFPIYSMRNERKCRLKERIKLSGISNTKYYLGSLLGFIGIGIVCTIPGYVFSIFVLKTNWGHNLIFSYLAIFTLNILFISIGMLMECLCKDTDKASNILQVIIFPVLSFLGGCYISLPDNVGGLFQSITNISPLRWINRGILKMAFAQDYSIIIPSMIINVLISIVIIIVMLIVTKKEEVRA